MIRWIETIYPEAVKMDGFDDCIVGIVHRHTQGPIICYDIEKVKEKLKSEGMTEEEAVEYMDYNQMCAWVGARTPCFLERPL